MIELTQVHIHKLFLAIKNKKIEMEHKEKYLWISNNQIHKEAKISIHEFLKITSCVETLRVCSLLNFTLYPTSEEEYSTNLKLWDYVNKNRNSLNNYCKIFNIQFPKPLLYFLKHTNRADVIKPIVLGLAGLYIYAPEKRKILEQQLYPPIFEKVVSIVDKYFKDFLDIVFIESYENEEITDEDDSFYISIQAFRDRFDLAYKEYAKNSIMYQFVNPFDNMEKYNSAIMENEFDIKLPHAYMSNDDWKRIIIEKKPDSLQRVESQPEPFNEWKYDLFRYHKGVNLPI